MPTLMETWHAIPTVDKVAIGVGMLPVVGDGVSAGISGGKFVANPSWTSLGDFALDGVGLLPFVPALGSVRRADRVSGAAQAANKAENVGGARYIGQPDGKVVDTRSTPRGSYEQPGGGRTDILQADNHGAGLSHTHDPKINTNPKTGETFVNGRQNPGRPVSAEDVKNIESGSAPRSQSKKR